MQQLTSQSGFTLIEMIVALGVFAVVTTITSGAMLMLVATNQKFHYEQSIMTNLSFAVDSMTREMRTGFNYYCASASASTTGIFGSLTDHESLGTSRRDCATGRGNSTVHGVSFYESGDSITGVTAARILYFYDAASQMIYRRVGNSPAQPIISTGVRVTSANFFVTGSTPLVNGGNRVQPAITIFMSARAADDTGPAPRTYELQTTVSQRSLDI